MFYLKNISSFLLKVQENINNFGFVAVFIIKRKRSGLIKKTYWKFEQLLTKLL